MKTRDLDTALQAFCHKGGMLRTRDLIALGVHTSTRSMSAYTDSVPPQSKITASNGTGRP